jgi:hypothetical protein
VHTASDGAMQALPNLPACNATPPPSERLWRPDDLAAAVSFCSPMTPDLSTAKSRASTARP